MYRKPIKLAVKYYVYEKYNNYIYRILFLYHKYHIWYEVQSRHVTLIRVKRPPLPRMSMRARRRLIKNYLCTALLEAGKRTSISDVPTLLGRLSCRGPINHIICRQVQEHPLHCIDSSGNIHYIIYFFVKLRPRWLSTIMYLILCAATFQIQRVWSEF